MLLMDGKALSKAIATAAIATAKGKKGRNLPVLECVKIDAAEGYLTAVGYDLETSITANIPAGTNGTGLHAVLEAKALLQVLKSAKGTIALDEEGPKIVITAGAARHQLQAWDLKEFPELPKITAEWMAEICGKEFADALAQVIAGASDDDARPGLETVCFEAHKPGENSATGEGLITLTTADGFRLHQATVRAVLKSDHKVIIPAAAIRAAQKMIKAENYASVRLWIEGNYKPGNEATQKVMIECGSGSLCTLGSYYQYPDYLQIIPKKYGFGARIPKAELLETIGEAEVAGKGGSGALRLHFKGKDLTVTVKSDGQEYQRTIVIGAVGPDELLIGVNAKFFGEAIEPCKGDVVILEANLANQPIGIRYPAGGYLAIVMPMHIG